MEIIKMINHKGVNYTSKTSLKRKLENELGKYIDEIEITPSSKLKVFELLTGSHSITISEIIKDLKNLSKLDF